MSDDAGQGTTSPSRAGGGGTFGMPSVRSDDIIVSGGGSTSVAPDRLVAAEAQLAALAAELDELAARMHPATALIAAPQAARLADAGARAVEAVASRARGLSRALHDAAEAYGAAERAAQHAATSAGELFGWLLGALAPLGVALVASSASTLLPAALIAFVVGSARAGSASAYLSSLRGAAMGELGRLRDPRVVALLRLVVSSADDAMLARLGVPAANARLLGDRGTGVFGLHGAAGVIVAGAAPFGALRETPVRVDSLPGSTTATRSPATYGDLAARIPAGGSNGAQVRVERYTGSGGRPVFVAYVGGTVTMSPVARGEPFDLTSNLAGVARHDPAALRVTEDALRRAGARPGDTVIPVGYSQGGIVATELVASGDYHTPAIVTFGSPTGGIDLPPQVVDVAVEHTDDLVPALGGEPREFDDGGADRILVRRQTFSGELPADSSPVDAHLLSEYADTARRMDASTDRRLSSALSALPAGDGEGTLYRGVRVAEPVPEPAPERPPLRMAPPPR
jgi:hypothetical protein